MNCFCCWKHRRRIRWNLSLIVLMIIPWLSASGTADESIADLDGDGIVDSVDADQDNDGLLNSQEGLVHLTWEDLPSPAVYAFAPLEMEVGEQNREVRYLLQQGEGPAWLQGEVVGSVVSVNWQQDNRTPKLQHIQPGAVTVEWTLWNGHAVLPFDVDYKISDLDVERQESVTVEQTSIVGYSLSRNSSINVDVSDNLISFSAIRGTDGDSNAVLLHVRDRYELRIQYQNSEPADTDFGVRAGFVHAFDNSGMESYTIVPSQTDSDGDGTPDHRDTDSNNNGVADVVEAGFVEDVLDVINAPVNSLGVPLFENEAAGISPPSVTVDSDGDGLDGRQEWYLGTNKTLFDTDGDGFGDGEEVTVYHTNPLNAESSPLAPSDESQDNDLDGIADVLETSADSDGDGIPNHFDLDSDNDGIPDRTEGFQSEPIGNHDSGYLERTLVDTDNDQIADIYDLDSDDDGLYDLIEAGHIDLDENGVIDTFVDKNSNGWHDLFERADITLLDLDIDGIPDFLDADDEPNPLATMQDDMVLANPPSVANDSMQIATGVNGGGCVLGTDSRDSSMILLLIVVLLFGAARCQCRV